MCLVDLCLGGKGRVRGHWNCMYFFGRIVVGRFKWGKMG